jgi:uncharacterized protein
MPETSIQILKSLNTATTKMLSFIFEGKAFGIFSILFGFTFGLLNSKAQLKGKDFRIRFLWRMLILILFGIINAGFFAGGDPLVFMAIVAIILPVLVNCKNRTIIIIATILFLQPIELFKTISLIFNPDIHFSNNTDVLYAQIKPFVTNGNFIPMFWNNMTTGLHACLTWAFEFGRVSQTPALFLVGFLLFKYKLFIKINHKFLEKLLITTLICAPILYLVKATFFINHPVCRSFYIATNKWYNLSTILLILALFVILFRTDNFQKLTQNLQIYGRMSLTNFIAQSIISTFVFYPYGLNLSEYCGVFFSVMIGFAIGIVQIKISKWWLNKHKQGPLEFLWHKLTYLFE